MGFEKVRLDLALDVETLPDNCRYRIRLIRLLVNIKFFK